MTRAINTTQSTSASVNALLSTSQWEPSDTSRPALTYSFVTTESRFDPDYSTAQEQLAVENFNTTLKNIVKARLAELSNVIAVDFNETTDVGHETGIIRFGLSSRVVNAGAWSYMPGDSARAGDVWIHPSQTRYIDANGRFYFQHLVLHEILHALGLKHPFEATAPFYEVLPRNLDIIPMTVMSYSEFPGVENTALERYPVSPMYLDIAALQWMYGPAIQNPTNTIYNLSEEPFQSFYTLWDSGGIDTLDASQLQSPLSLSLEAGVYNSLGVRISADNGWFYDRTFTIAIGAEIENLIGSRFNDELFGNDANNLIDGAAGNDSIWAGAGDDILIGGPGRNMLNGGPGSDEVTYIDSINNYEISKKSSIYEVRRINNASSDIDSLVDVEKIKFQDIHLNLTIQTTATQIADTAAKKIKELYIAFFNRIPDADGLEYWMQEVIKGKSLVSIADSFYNAGLAYSSLTGYSAEMTNQLFIGLVYRNVLGRLDGGDQEGIDFWANQLERGAETRGSVISTILDSAHTFKGDRTYGYVADLLDNKAYVANEIAVHFGINFSSPEVSITKGKEIAIAVKADDYVTALSLVGINYSSIELL